MKSSLNHSWKTSNNQCGGAPQNHSKLKGLVLQYWSATTLTTTDSMAMLPSGWISLDAMLHQGQTHTLAI